jgi:hypothetical protein
MVTLMCRTRLQLTNLSGIWMLRTEHTFGCNIPWVLKYSALRVWRSRTVSNGVLSSAQVLHMRSLLCVCVHGDTNAQCFRSILNELGLSQVGPALLNVDNIAAVVMSNAGKPTERSHHIDIQLFTLLTCIKVGGMLLAHIKVTDNPYDSLAKALCWVLHHLHCYHMMGLVGSP